LMSRQQVQPALRVLLRQLQQAWIISAALLVAAGAGDGSRPLAVFSQRHRPMVRLQVQTTMPLRVTQQLHMPPWSMVQRFCTMVAATCRRRSR